MKAQLLCILLIASCANSAFAGSDTESSTDSISRNMLLDEVVITSNLKAGANILQTPASITAFNARQIEQDNITSIKGITALAPNFFIPDYGSKLTTAIYIRGIGTRTNNSVVGMYVDNVPYLDKSIFDFDFLDIERLEILRGPQSVLYGRNTMAGLINIYTKSPFDHQYTKLAASYDSNNSYRLNLSHYGRTSEKLAYSFSGQYMSNNGYFNNSYTGRKADKGESAYGRLQLYWRPDNSTRVNLTTNLEYSNQDGYPYGIMSDGKISEVNYNDPGAYQRWLSSSTLFVEKKAEKFTMTNSLGFQFFDDEMKLDQDFTPMSIFTLNQKQRQSSFSNELVFKSNGKSNFKWLAGAFGFYQNLTTNAPVTFKKEGIDLMVNKNIADNIPPIQMGPMTITLSDSLINENMVIAGVFKTPTWGAAGYTQLTYDNLLIDGLSVSAGARIDYEQSKLDYNTSTTAFARGRVNVSGRDVATFVDTLEIGYKGYKRIDNIEILPRFDIRYAPGSSCMAYASVSKGYRAGGFNFQMFSDAVRNQLQSRMIGAFIGQAEKIGMGDKIPDTVREMANVADADIDDQITYKPEYSWNYEIGTHSVLFDHKLSVDLSAFYINVRNQQISTFSDDGLGRVTRNSGKSRSFGAEAGIRFSPVPELGFSINYGWTNARFSEYTFMEKDDDQYKEVSYNGNYIPFAPEHTGSASVNYLLNINKPLIDNINFYVQYAGLGRLYWNETNDQYQDFYGTLDAKISIRKGGVELSFWGKNITDEQYTAFYFESLGKNLAQRGTPQRFGVDISYKF